MAAPVSGNVLGPLDSGLFTGPARLLAGIVRQGAVVLDTPYTNRGIPQGEFARWLYVGTTGDVTYVEWDGTVSLCANMVAGIWHPIASVQINSAGTTAGDLRWGS